MSGASDMNAITAQIQAEWERLLAGKSYTCVGCHQHAVFGPRINGWVHVERCSHCGVTAIIDAMAHDGYPATINVVKDASMMGAHDTILPTMPLGEFIRTYMA